MEKKNKKTETPESLLKTFKMRSGKTRREVIYGVYDSSKQPMLVQLEDFLIDHSRVPLDEKAYFFHLLAVMSDAGVPLMQALKILAARTSSERFYRVINTVLFNIIQGKKFSESIARFPDVFGDMEVGIVKAGEAAGNLDKMLFRISEQLEKSQELQIKILTASIYPIAVLTVLALVASGMLIWVVPSLLNIFTEGGMTMAELPFATRLLLNISYFLSNYWWALLMCLIIAYLLFRVYINSENGRYRWDLFRFKIPTLGALMRKILILRFISTLGILIESGLPVIQSLTIIATSLNSELYRLKVWEVIARVQQGEKISETLADSPFLFPETVTQMLSVAEQSAAIGIVSEKLSAHYEREIDNEIKRLTSLFEPIMIVTVGVTVALLAIAILTPIFSLSQSIK